MVVVCPIRPVGRNVAGVQDSWVGPSLEGLMPNPYCLTTRQLLNKCGDLTIV